MNVFIEMRIIEAVRELLTGRVNELLGDWKYLIPVFEISNYQGEAMVVPVIALSSCERTEKERIIFLDAYSLTISFNVPETQNSELYCYTYANAICQALQENTTLGGVADKVTISGKKYVPPKRPGCGQDWEAVISLRVTVENQITSNR